jgi:hypothetical protein
MVLILPIFVELKTMKVQGINTILQKLLLIVLFAAALNLSCHVAMPQQFVESDQSGSIIDEQSYQLLPFGEKEANQTSHTVVSVQTLPFSFNSQWSPLQIQKATLELFSYRNTQVFKEYPFVVLVRNLRI